MSDGQKLTIAFQVADDTLVKIVKACLVLLNVFTLYNFIIKTNSSAEKNTSYFSKK